MTRWGLVIVFAATLAACKKHEAGTPSKPPPKEVGGERFRSETTANLIDPAFVGTGKTFLVVSESASASKAGRDVLAAGGNAVDAAVATAFALAVTHPTAGNLGGGGFAVVRAGKGHTTALDFRETAPAAPIDAVKDDKAVGVPGTVAGLWELHHKYGQKPWKDLVAPAIALARDGFAVDGFLHQSIERRKDVLAKNPASAALWAPGGKPRETGEVVKNPDLQAALERIADRGADGFYKGPTAQAVVDEMKRGGGVITAADLEAYKPVWREPLVVDYRGRRIATMPLPSTGGVVLAMSANMLRAVDVAKLGWHSADHVHHVVEVWRRAFAARNTLLADGAPVDKLLSQAFADQLAVSIGPAATPSSQVPALLEGHHTTNLCVVDAKGMAVALTYTLNTSFGNGVTVSGFLLNNEMDDFPAGKIEPGKRPLSAMTPAVVEDDNGELAMIVGAAGGPRIPTAVWQVVSNVVDFGMDVDAAVAAPRFHHQHLPDSVRIEAEAITKDTDKALRTMKYTLDWSQPPREFGAANAIVRTTDGWKGAADPRGGGAAMGD